MFLTYSTTTLPLDGVCSSSVSVNVQPLVGCSVSIDSGILFAT